MSNKTRPRQYADRKGSIVEGFDGNIVEAEGSAVPTDGTAGYAPGATFRLRAGAVGAALYINEGSATSCAFKAVQQQAGNYVKRGVASITGSGTVATGLTTVVSVVATLQDDAALTGDTVTATIGDQAGTPAAGSVILKVWKPTASGDCTPIAATAAKSVNWIAVGT